MKIVFLTDEFPPKNAGGSGVIAYWQARALAKRGHQVMVITAATEEVDKGVRDDSGVRVHKLFGSSIVRQVDDILALEKPDIVHAHNVHQFLSYRTLAVARKHAKLVVITLHDAMSVHYSKIFPRMSIKSDGTKIFDYRVSSWHQLRYFWRIWRPLRRSRIRRQLKKAHRIFAVSNALADALRQNGLKRVEVMHNSIDTKEMMASTQEVDAFKEQYGLTSKKILLFGGRISRAKGGEVALHLLARLADQNPDLRLVIAGRENHYTNYLRSKAEDMNVLDKIVFVGWLDRREMSFAYASADIVLTLSIYMDPFPTVNLEAMAAKRAVLGTCFGGTPEAVKEGVTGRVVNPLDLDGTASVLKEMLNHGLLQKFGQAGFDLVQSEFSLDKHIDGLLQIYDAG